MEMPLQPAEREGEEPCSSECVSQPALAMAVQCGPYSMWVWTGEKEYCVYDSGVAVFLLTWDGM